MKHPITTRKRQSGSVLEWIIIIFLILIILAVAVSYIGHIIHNKHETHYPPDEWIQPERGLLKEEIDRTKEPVPFRPNLHDEEGAADTAETDPDRDEAPEQSSDLL